MTPLREPNFACGETLADYMHNWTDDEVLEAAIKFAKVASGKLCFASISRNWQESSRRHMEQFVCGCACTVITTYLQVNRPDVLAKGAGHAEED